MGETFSRLRVTVAIRSMPLRNKIASSILNMGIQRVLDFVSTLLVTSLVVRSLSRHEYGILSMVLSYGLIFNIFNISVSAILLRDYPKIKERIGDYMQAFLLFSLFKSSAILLLSILIGYLLYQQYHSLDMIVILSINVLCTVFLFMTEPFSVLLSVNFRQSIITKISLASAIMNVVLSIGTIYFPTALFVSVKNIILATVILLMTVTYAKRVFTLKQMTTNITRLRLIKECFIGFSLWSHLSGVMTDIIYRADLLILGWLGTPFQIVGNYNISLQMSNFTKLMPQILQYNTTLGLSNTDDEQRREEITFLFIKYSFVLSLITFIAYILFGRLAIRIIADRDIEEIFNLGTYIIGGLCIFNTFRPLISYGMVVHDVRQCLLYAITPSCIAIVTCYVVMGKAWGTYGLALANLLGGIIMTLLILLYIHRKTNFRWRVNIVTDIERQLLALLKGKLGTLILAIKQKYK